MESLTRYRRHPSLNTERRTPNAEPPMPMPGLPPPGTGSVITPPVHNYPAPGPTTLGYAYANDVLLDTAIQTAQTTADNAVTYAGTPRRRLLTDSPPAVLSETVY